MSHLALCKKVREKKEKCKGSFKELCNNDHPKKITSTVHWTQIRTANNVFKRKVLKIRYKSYFLVIQMSAIKSKLH